MFHCKQGRTGLARDPRSLTRVSATSLLRVTFALGLHSRKAKVPGTSGATCPVGLGEMPLRRAMGQYQDFPGEHCRRRLPPTRPPSRSLRECLRLVQPGSCTSSFMQRTAVCLSRKRASKGTGMTAVLIRLPSREDQSLGMLSREQPNGLNTEQKKDFFGSILTSANCHEDNDILSAAASPVPCAADRQKERNFETDPSSLTGALKPWWPHLRQNQILPMPAAPRVRNVRCSPNRTISYSPRLPATQGLPKVSDTRDRSTLSRLASGQQAHERQLCGEPGILHDELRACERTEERTRNRIRRLMGRFSRRHMCRLFARVCGVRTICCLTDGREGENREAKRSSAPTQPERVHCGSPPLAPRLPRSE